MEAGQPTCQGGVAGGRGGGTGPEGGSPPAAGLDGTGHKVAGWGHKLAGVDSGVDGTAPSAVSLVCWEVLWTSAFDGVVVGEDYD